MEKPLQYHIKIAEESDLDQLSLIEREAFSENWPPTSFRREIKNKNTSVLVAYFDRQVNSSQAPDILSEREKNWTSIVAKMFQYVCKTFRSSDKNINDLYLVGYVSTRYMYDETHVIAIAVRQSHRGHGVGEFLLRESILEGIQKNSKQATLEVRVSNKVAQSLYVKYGFEFVGTRKRYYSDNNEDAYIMTVEDIGSDKYIRQIQELKEAYNKKREV